VNVCRGHSGALALRFAMRTAAEIGKKIEGLSP
jgi:hypothetical protein